MTLTPINNGGFETPGTDPWMADGWDIITKASVEEYADFSGLPFDGFEIGWQNDIFYTELVSPVSAEFGPIPPQGYEAFERDWDIDDWGDELLAPIAAAFDAGTPEDFEDFEDEWDDNHNYKFAFGGGDLTAADFDTSPEPHEDFEEEWRDNHNYKFEFSGGDLTAADFDTTPEAYEDFEEEWTLTMETI